MAVKLTEASIVDNIGRDCTVQEQLPIDRLCWLYDMCYIQSFKNKEASADLGDEMADVLFVLICLANQTGVDLTAALEKNIQKKTIRDKERHQNNEKLQP